MNRNVESHFAQLPHANIQRSTFDRSSSYKTSFNAGRLIPFYVDEVLPGDTFDITTAKVVRSHTMLTPVMDNMYLDTYWFFVPNRLVWDHWQEFCGENTGSAWAPSVEYTIPKMYSPAGGFASGTIADYMGLPVNVDFNSSSAVLPSALPFRAYALICNEFFRDENLTDPLNIPTGDANQTGTNGDVYLSDVANGGMPFKVAKYHDYFTSALPGPQKRTSPVSIPVNLSMANSLPVVPGNRSNVNTIANNGSVVTYYGGFRNNDGQVGDISDPPGWISSGSVYAAGYTGASMGSSGTSKNAPLNAYLSDSDGGVSTFTALTPLNLFAVSDEETSGSFTVNELRLAVALQTYYETLARSGSRYIELLKGIFGVTSPDARLQRPEYLGGNRIAINVSEVTNTAQAERDFLGDLGAKSNTTDVNHDFVHSFVEHGYLIGLCCIRYDHSYSQGLKRFWTRSTFTDFYNPLFANLGEVPVYTYELYATASNLKSEPDIFGYQEIWADYRYKPNMVTGEMRPGVDNTLAQWNLADYYEKSPTLSDEWIREDATVIDRVLAVGSDVSNQFWADIYVKNICTRPMPMYSIPSLEPRF